MGSALRSLSHRVGLMFLQAYSLSPMFPESDVPSVLCSLSPMFPQPRVPSLRSLSHRVSLVFLQPCVPSVRCSLSPMFLQPYVPSVRCSCVPTIRCSLGPMFPQSDVPSALCSLSPMFLCSHNPMFPQSCVPSVRCTLSPVFPRAHLHVVGMLRFMSDINHLSLPTPFYFVLLSVYVSMALSTVFYYINSPNNTLLSNSVLPVLFLPYWSFQLYIF